MKSPNTSILKERSNGFTLVEMLVVLGIFVIVVSFALLASMDVYRGNSLHAEKNTVISILQRARSRAMNNMCLNTGCTDGQQHGVNFADPDKYAIFEGPNLAADASPEDIEVSSKVANSGLTEIVFDQLTGNPTCNPSPCNLVLTGDGRSFTITINAEGGISWN